MNQRAWLLGTALLCAVSFTGCGGETPRTADNSAPKSGPPAATPATNQGDAADAAPRQRMPAVAGSGGGSEAAEANAGAPPASSGGPSRMPSVAGSGGGGSAAAAVPAGQGDGGASGGGAPRQPNVAGSGSGGDSGGSSASMALDSGSGSTGGAPAGMNNLPPGYGGQGGPPQQGGPPAGYNNLPPGYGGGSQDQGGSSSMSLDPGGGFGGGPPAAGPGSFNPQANQPPAQVEEKSFWDMASNAYASGREADGYTYLLAEFATNRSKFSEIPLSFVEGKKDTTIGVRIGLAVTYTAQEGVSGKPPVIGDPAPARASNQGGGRRPGASGGSSTPPPMSGPPGGGFPGGGDSVPKDAKGILTYYGGDLSKALLDQLEQRFKKNPSVFGQVWARTNFKVMLSDDAQRSQPVNTGGGGGGSSRMPSMSGSGGAPPVGGGFGQPAGPPEGLYPGLVFLGVGPTPEHLRKAKSEGLDGLIILDHRASIIRTTGQTTSQTTVKFYTVDDGKEKAATGQLSYASVAQQVSANKDPVGDALKDLFVKVERFLAAKPMPELTETLAKGRLDSVVSNAKNDPLPFVCEVNYYLQQGWLQEDDAQQYIIQVLGEQAALGLWTGEFNQQKSALARWLPAT